MRRTRSKWLALVLSTAILLLMATACGGRTESPTPTPEASTPQPAAATEVPPTATAAPTPTPVPTNTPTPEPAPEAEAASSLPNVPLPEDAEEVSYKFEELIFTSPSDVETLVEFFRTALTEEGWQELSDYSLVEEEFAYAEFEQEGETIELTIFGADGSSEAFINLSGAPSLTGALGGSSSGMTIADWPTPPDATEVDVSGDTLSFKTALSLEDVAEFYRPTYESLGLATQCLEDVADYTSVSCSFGNGDFSVYFFAFEGFAATEVEIEFANYALESSADGGEMGVDDEDGLPLPDDRTGYSSESGEFRRMTTLFSPSDLETLVDFFETELVSRGWTLDDSDQSTTETTLRFSGPDGELVVTLQVGDETEVVLVQRNQAAAEEAGVLPPAGQARLFLVNFTESDMTVTIDGQTIAVAPGAGMDSPDDAPQIDLSPSAYNITTEVDGSSVTDEIVVGPDESWVLLLDEEGALPLQMY